MHGVGTGITVQKVREIGGDEEGPGRDMRGRNGAGQDLRDGVSMGMISIRDDFHPHAGFCY